MKLKRYCVTVMDHWTPTKTFWSLGGALRHASGHSTAAHVFLWNDGWRELRQVWLPETALTVTKR